MGKHNAANAWTRGRRRGRLAIDSEAERKRCESRYVVASLLYWRTGVRYEVDHRYPWAQGGPHCFANLGCLTASANRAKGDRIPEGLRLEKVGLRQT